MSSLKGKKKKKRARAPDKIKYTDEIKRLYQMFIKPVISTFNYADDESSMVEGLHWFFHTNTRHVHFCKAKAPFLMPGACWRGLNEPQHLMPPAHADRIVTKGAPLVTRVDDTMPNRVEVEHKDKMFVMTQAEWSVVKEKLEFIL